MWPSDQTTPAEVRQAPPKAAAPRITARPTQPPTETPQQPSADAPAQPPTRTPAPASGEPSPASGAAPASAAALAGPVDSRAPERLRSLPTWLLSQAAASGAALVDEALAADSLRKQDYRVLVALDEAGSASQADLGRSVWLDRSDLHGIVTQLERRGLIERERDPRDRRRNVVQLTSKGRQTLGQLNARVDAAQDLLLRPMSATDRAAFVRLLTALTFEDYVPEARP